MANVDLAQASQDFHTFFTIKMTPLFGVMTAFIFAFILGLGVALTQAQALKKACDEFGKIITLTISRVIIPLLPYYICSIFLEITAAGAVVSILSVFVKIIVVIFALTIVLLLIQFGIAGLVARKNPLRLLKTMLPAYATALGTQSSAATIPVTYAQAQKCGVREPVAAFVIPLCATVHLAGSMLKIVACAVAIMMITGLEINTMTFVGFIFLLAITMIAAPGVPGGAIMAALAPLASVLGFGEIELGLMIALYIAMDSFGTATNVTGDGSIAVLINAIE